MKNIDIKKIIEENKETFYHDLAKIIEIPSVKSEAKMNAPFGVKTKEALEEVMKLAKSYGFETKIVKDAMGYAQWGNEDEYIGVVGHLDVVPAGSDWSFPPFALSKASDRLYGRGILDNKGPIMACLFGMKLLKDQGIKLKRTIRIIFGTDEESGSTDIPMYLSEEQPPLFGFTPDCKYPVVYGERGIVNYKITTTLPASELAHLGEILGDQAMDHVPDLLETTVNGHLINVIGKRSPTNAPEMGINAITLLAKKLYKEDLVSGQLRHYFGWLNTHLTDKHYGEGLGLNFSDKESGSLILTPYKLTKEESQISLEIAIRYPISVTEAEITNILKKQLLQTSNLTIVRQIKSHHFPKEDKHVQLLSKVYEAVTQKEGTPVTTTGATYARFMPNLVAFGPSFPGQKGIAHNKDEYMDEIDLLKNMEIYMHALIELGQN
ncbi:Sapep family Mn(2+)-dependent dipeptidase [Melissococcus plutonius]|nr:Sapep family Mn(2+)-dependent dipeptidase [Melissococcus plutonius]BAL62720.1 putative dipeptidase [Melissococcus plutonius DAT561]MCV2498638.1 Sapep family Mn(2+)-dependent dipeptidase [Melissococcus plutonius]MCV2500747.1 Sapep family Mn(2+)-dependent dipeptidase [Melissococcus plutonius]MCV2504695.1 Sapep family Mn(2+)-dependent dipeptidase [Melissococcus plutonius]MCV2507154.1 Sapep family Mn(2+)-dependent dipeptidase [Melissococcus plutonius]